MMEEFVCFLQKKLSVCSKMLAQQVSVASRARSCWIFWQIASGFAPVLKEMRFGIILLFSIFVEVVCSDPTIFLNFGNGLGPNAVHLLYPSEDPALGFSRLGWPYH